MTLIATAVALAAYALAAVTALAVLNAVDRALARRRRRVGGPRR